MSSESEGRRRVRELFDGLNLNDEQVNMIRRMLGAGTGVHEYIGRYEIGGFGHDFLPDAFTDQGDVHSIGSWIEEMLGTTQPGKIKVRITVEKLS